MVCGKCGRDEPDGDSYCRACGALLSASERLRRGEAPWIACGCVLLAALLLVALPLLVIGHVPDILPSLPTEPAYEEPAYVEPAYEEPANEDQANEGQADGGAG